MADYPEQDKTGGDSLPTYEDLAAQQGPNSRFGRWKGWVEKRAAERHVDLTPEVRARRRERGWGETTYQVSGDIQDIRAVDEQPTVQPEPFYLHPDSAAAQATLHPQPSFYSRRSSWSGVTVQAASNDPPGYIQMPMPSLTGGLPPIPSGEPVLPSHVKVHNFGSRFLPHTTYPLNALLPLMGDRLLLIGHDNGLSVLDMSASGGMGTSSTTDAQVRPIWEGEGVFQLEVLEFQDTGDGTPHGVVLALVGAEVEVSNSKERDEIRSIRMYNLASLTSLARWAVTQKNAKPLDLRRPTGWTPQQAKKHRQNSSIHQKLKSLVLSESSHTLSSPSSSNGLPQSSYPESSTKINKAPLERNMSRHSHSSDDSSWDFIDELPLRWATDYVPLASSGSRLLNLNVLFFELSKKKGAVGSRGTTSLAIATRQSILLYETPKGERAFRFSKEFYTPLIPRNLSFLHQTSADTPLLRTPSTSSTKSTEKATRRFSSIRQSLDATRDRDLPTSSGSQYGPQLSLFVVFDKKAGLIRLADSTVSEVEMPEESPNDALSPTSGSPRRSFFKEQKGVWLPPAYEELTLGAPNGVVTISIYILTRGKQTHIVPAPMPTPLSSCQPLYSVAWHNLPIDISHRVCSPLDDPSFLQLIGFSEYGIEVLEIPLSVFNSSAGSLSKSNGNGKGKSRLLPQEEPVRAQADIGGDVAFLCRGGHWDEPHRYLTRSDSVSSYSSVSTARTGRMGAGAEAGYYAAVRKGLEDWRVCWIGGDEKDESGI